MTAKLDVERFVDDLKCAIREGEPQPAAHEVLARAVSDPSGVLAGIGEPKAPGLHVLHHAADLTVLDVVWAPLMILLPHNHDMWASIGIYTGREDNILWQRRGSVAEAVSASSLSGVVPFAVELREVTAPGQ